MKRLPAACICFCVAALAACGARTAETRNPHIIVAAWIAGPDSFNPLTAVGSAARMVNDMIYAPLLDIGADLLPQWKTSLAYRIDVTNAGKRYVLHLRRGVKWSDGAAFTARDVVFSLRVGNNPNVLESSAADFKLMTAVRALDPYTVEVRLSSPSPPFLENALGETLPLPEHILGRYPPESDDEAKFINNDGDFAQNPVTSGPWRILRNVRDSYTILERNPRYFGQPATLEQIAFRVYPQQDSLYAAVDAGEVDVTDIAPNLWRIHDRLRGDHKFITWPWNVTFLLLPNYRDPAIAWVHDVRVKQALEYAIDRGFIIRGIMSGQADLLNGPLPSFSPYYNGGVMRYSYDPAKARALLDAAGWRSNGSVRMKDGKTLRFTLKTGGATDAVAANIAELIQANMRAVGVDCTLQNEELQTFFEDLHNSRFQVALRGIILPAYPDDYKFYDSHQTRANGGYNVGSYSNAAIDRAIERARGASSPEIARRALKDYQSIASRQLPVWYLYSVRLGAVVPSRLTGYELDPRAPAALPMGMQFWRLSPASASASAR